MNRRFVASFVKTETSGTVGPYYSQRMDIEALGRGMRERRLARNLGIEGMVKDAARRGIDVPAMSYISRLERGKAVRPGAIELEALAEALEVRDYKDFEAIGRGELDPRTLKPPGQAQRQVDVVAVARDGIRAGGAASSARKRPSPKDTPGRRAPG